MFDSFSFPAAAALTSVLALLFSLSLSPLHYCHFGYFFVFFFFFLHFTFSLYLRSLAPLFSFHFDADINRH